MAAGLSIAQRVAAMPAEQQQAWLDALEADLLEEVARREWWFVARPEQLLPEGDWLIWLILAGRGFGKALDVATPIPTPSGWTTMGELAVGDRVLSADGTPTEVTFVTEVQRDRTCYLVRFSDGAELVADADHQWTVRSRADRRAGRGYRTVTTQQMIDAGMTVAGERRWQMPTAAALELPEAELPVDPYVLGVWLGDGSSAAGEVTIGDRDSDETLRLLAARGYPVTGTPRRKEGAACATYPIGGKPGARGVDGRMIGNDSLASRLRAIGVLHNKHIPMAYLRSSRRQREELLAGIIDSDGHVNHSNGVIEVTMTRPELAHGVAELVRTLGSRCSVYDHEARINGRSVGRRYRVTWVARSGGGLLRRKALADRHHLGQPDRLTTRFVESITPVQSRPVRCISVAHPSRLYLAGEQFAVTHNTRAGAETIVDWAVQNPVDVDGHPTEWLVVAETLADGRKQCLEGPSGIINVLRRRGIGFEYVKAPSPVVTLERGQKVHVKGADADVGRGYNLAGAWLDEMAKWLYPKQAWTEGLGPALRTRTPTGHKPRAIVTTTPKPIRLLVEWVARDDGSVHLTRGSTFDNAANLSPEALEEFRRQYGSSRIGRQELYAELLTDIEGALWHSRWIEDGRRTPEQLPETTQRIVAVDPAVSATETSDETGLIAVGRGVDGHDYVLADRSARVVGFQAAKRAWQLWLDLECDLMVYEDNQGQDWVRDILVDAWKKLVADGKVGGDPPLKAIRAMRGKRLRAEPVAARYEQGRVHHVGSLVDLEQQMLEWEPESGKSPDRLDALVHGITALRGPDSGHAKVVNPAGTNLAERMSQAAALAKAVGNPALAQRAASAGRTRPVSNVPRIQRR